MIEDHPIYKEVEEAYYDCAHDDDPLEIRLKRRNLSFRASQAVDRDTSFAILENLVPGYNNFCPELLLHLPEGCEIFIAREGSVCLYVKGKLPKKLWRKLDSDEWDYSDQSDETRIWWD